MSISNKQNKDYSCLSFVTTIQTGRLEKSDVSLVFANLIRLKLAQLLLLLVFGVTISRKYFQSIDAAGFQPKKRRASTMQDAKTLKNRLQYSLKGVDSLLMVAKTALP